MLQEDDVMMKKVLLKLIIFSCFGANVYADPLDLKIAFLQQVKGDPETLVLEDVLDKNLTSSEIINQYGKISVSFDASSGTLNPSHVMMALNRAGARIENIQMLNPADIKIVPSNKSQVIFFIKKHLLEKIASKESKDVSDIKVQFSEPGDDLPLRSSFSSVKFEDSFLDSIKNSQQLQVFYLDQEGRTLRTGNFKVDLFLSRKVIVSKKALMPGSWVTSDDFEELELKLSRKDHYVQSLDEIKNIRFQLNQGLEKGAPLYKDNLNQKITFNKGDVVTLIVGDGAFKITALGRILEIHDNGNSVVVENIDSKKELIGTPVSKNEVKIAF